VFLNSVADGSSWEITVVGNPPPSGLSWGDLQSTKVAPGAYPTDLLVTAPNGSVYALEIGLGLDGEPGTIQTAFPPRSGGTGNIFTPAYPPCQKQPFGCWGMEAKRVDSVTVGGIKRSVLERIDTVTTLQFPYVALSDMAAWKAFQQYALGGGEFTYRAVPGYAVAPSSEPMFQFPGADNGDDVPGYSVVQALSMDWTPKFKSPGIFSLEMKLKLVEDVTASVPGVLTLEDGSSIALEDGTGGISLEE
jgi:hypothetical protein